MLIKVKQPAQDDIDSNSKSWDLNKGPRIPSSCSVCDIVDPQWTNNKIPCWQWHCGIILHLGYTAKVGVRKRFSSCMPPPPPSPSCPQTWKSMQLKGMGRGSETTWGQALDPFLLELVGTDEKGQWQRQGNTTCPDLGVIFLPGCCLPAFADLFLWASGLPQIWFHSVGLCCLYLLKHTQLLLSAFCLSSLSKSPR